MDEDPSAQYVVQGYTYYQPELNRELLHSFMWISTSMILRVCQKTKDPIYLEFPIFRTLELY